MSDPSRLVGAPDPRLSRSHVSWGVEIGPMRIALTRTQESLAAPPSLPSRGLGQFASGAVAGIGAVALLVVGASAAPRAVEPTRYMVSVPVPSAPAPRLARATPRRAATGHARPRSVPASVSDDAFDAADAPYVARAMATGAFQEWEDALGQRRFLTAGPAHFRDGQACRAMALLVRIADGGSHVRSAERCTSGPVSDPPLPDPEPSDS